MDRQAARGNSGQAPGQALQGSFPALIGVARLVRVPLHHHGHGRGNRRRGAWSDDHLPHVIDRRIEYCVETNQKLTCTRRILSRGGSAEPRACALKVTYKFCSAGTVDNSPLL